MTRNALLYAMSVAFENLHNMNEVCDSLGLPHSYLKYVRSFCNEQGYVLCYVLRPVKMPPLTIGKMMSPMDLDLLSLLWIREASTEMLLSMNFPLEEDMDSILSRSGVERGIALVHRQNALDFQDRIQLAYPKEYRNILDMSYKLRYLPHTSHARNTERLRALHWNRNRLIPEKETKE